MSFDYAYTCPKINKAISQAKDLLAAEIEDILSEACPLLEVSTRQHAAVNYAETVYNRIEDLFESVRSTNEDMRKEADHQIGKLETALAEARSEILQLELAAA